MSTYFAFVIFRPPALFCILVALFCAMNAVMIYGDSEIGHREKAESLMWPVILLTVAFSLYSIEAYLTAVPQ